MTDWNSMFSSAGFVVVDDPVGGQAWDQLPVGGIDDGSWLATHEPLAEDLDVDTDTDDDLVMGWRSRAVRADLRPHATPSEAGTADDAATEDGEGDGDDAGAEAMDFAGSAESAESDAGLAELPELSAFVADDSADDDWFSDPDADGFGSTDTQGDAETDLE